MMRALTPIPAAPLSAAYWEGAVQVAGDRAGQAVSGHGYVELTGYANSMQNQF